MIHGVDVHFDHCPLWVDTNGITTRRVGPRRFHFEAMWVEDKEYSNIIKKTWEGSQCVSNMIGVMGLISQCSLGLNQWNRSCFGNVQKKLHKAKLQLKEIQENKPGSVTSKLIDEARKTVYIWLGRDELM